MSNTKVTNTEFNETKIENQLYQRILDFGL